MRRALLAAAVLGWAAPVAAQPASDFLPRPDLAPPPQAAATPAPVIPPLPAAAAGVGVPLRGVLIEGASAIPSAELTPLWAPLVGKPASPSALEALAERIGAAYRARGYVLSQAVVMGGPTRDGIVRIAVIEGFIDRIAVEGGTPRQQATLSRLFAPVGGDRPLRIETLERSVLLARDTYGSGIDTVVEPSPDTFGAADMTVLADPQRYAGFASADNRGSRLYGALALSAGVSAYGLLDRDERIDGLIAFAPHDASLAYLEGVLDMPLAGLAGTFLDGGRLELHADTSHGEPDLTRSGSPNGLTVTSDETNLRAGLIVPFIRTRSQNLFGRIGVDWQDSTSVTGFAGGTVDSTDRLFVLRARASWDVADRFGGVSLVEAGVRQGIGAGIGKLGGEGPAAGDPDFTLATLDLTRLQQLGPDWALWLEGTGQLGADSLPNSERFALGGSTIGRGFAPGNTTGDSGWGGRIELRRQLVMPGDAARALELYVFGDYGRAYDRSLAHDGVAVEDLGSYGIGARVDLNEWLTLTPEIAQQAAGVATDTTRPGHETRFLIGVVARF